MTTEYKPHWKGPVPVPPIELYARPRGNMQWACPDCGNLHAGCMSFWKQAHIECLRYQCRHKFRVGVGFTQTEGCERALLMGRWNQVSNKLDPVGAKAVGRVFGVTDWQCPTCEKVQTSEIKFIQGSVTCISCDESWFVQLLIWRSGSQPKLLCPYDWAVYSPQALKDSNAQTHPLNTVAPAGHSARTEAPSGRLGKNCSNPNE